MSQPSSKNSLSSSSSSYSSALSCLLDSNASLSKGTTSSYTKSSKSSLSRLSEKTSNNRHNAVFLQANPTTAHINNNGISMQTGLGLNNNWRSLSSRQNMLLTNGRDTCCWQRKRATTGTIDQDSFSNFRTKETSGYNRLPLHFKFNNKIESKNKSRNRNRNRRRRNRRQNNNRQLSNFVSNYNDHHLVEDGKNNERVKTTTTAILTNTVISSKGNQETTLMIKKESWKQNYDFDEDNIFRTARSKSPSRF